MKTLAIILALITAIGVSTVPVSAQPGDQPMRKIEQFKKMKLLELLDMDEATANKFLIKYDKWQRDIIQMTEDRNSLAMELKMAMDTKAADDKLNGILDKLVDVTIKLDNAKHDMFIDLRTVLSPRQAVKLAAFEMQFQKKLHESLDKLREHGRDHKWRDE